MPENIGKVKLARGRAYVLRKLDEAAMVAVLNLGVQVVMTASEQTAPVDTGRLARSLTHSDPIRIRPFVWGINVGSNVEYAYAQEYGSGLFAEDETKRRKYKIIAGAFNPNTKSLSPKRALKFEWKNAPPGLRKKNPQHPIYFFRSIMHPGVKPKKYLRTAISMERTPDKLRKIWFKTFNAVFDIAA